MSGMGPLHLSLGHIACKQLDLPEAQFSPLKMCIRIPILQILGIHSDYYINIIVWNVVNDKFLSLLPVMVRVSG